MDKLILQVSVLLLCPDDCQDPRLLDRGDPIAHRPTSRSCAGPMPHLSLPLRPPSTPLPIHLPGVFDHHGRPRNPPYSPSRFPHAIPWHLPGRHGLLLRRSHDRLLVHHELKRTHGSKHRQRVDDWFREHGRVRGHFLLLGQRRSSLPHRLFSMYGSNVHWSAGRCAVRRNGDDGKQKRTEKRWERAREEAVFVISRLGRAEMTALLDWNVTYAIKRCNSNRAINKRFKQFSEMDKYD